MKTLPFAPNFLILAGMLAVTTIAGRAQLIDIDDGNGGNTITTGDFLLQPSTGTTVSQFQFNAGATNSFENTSGTGAGSVTSEFSIGEDSSSGDGPILFDPDLFTNYAVGAFTVPSVGSLDFTGLKDSQEYEILIYTRDQVDADGRSFALTNTTSSSDDLVYDSSGNAESGISMVDQEASTFSTAADSTEFDGYETFDGNYLEVFATTDSSGNLDLTFTNSGGGEFDISGLQLQTVPEPSTWAMMLGGLGLLLWIGRRRLRV